MKTTICKYLYLAACFVFWLFLALFSSRLIVDNVNSGYSYSNPVFRIHYLQNAGAAFNLFENSREFLIVVAIAAITLLFVYIYNNIRNIHFVSISFIALLAAGIAANCHERIVLGYVRDYIQLNFINFPVFNVADIFITIGVIAFVSILLFYKGK